MRRLAPPIKSAVTREHHDRGHCFPVIP